MKNINGAGSDEPQRSNYKKGKVASEKPSSKNLLQAAKSGKGLVSKSANIFGMGKK